eukprot:scaffold285_cov304-Pinguiococcus_pyrenoidosus.AAC.5
MHQKKDVVRRASLLQAFSKSAEQAGVLGHVQPLERLRLFQPQGHAADVDHDVVHLCGGARIQLLVVRVVQKVLEIP